MILPTFLGLLATDEFVPAPYSHEAVQAVRRVQERTRAVAERLGLDPRAYSGSRYGTAAGLLALNEAYSGAFYVLPPDAVIDGDAAAEAFGGREPVIDVQTHYLADRAPLAQTNAALLDLYRSLAPEWWTGLDNIAVLNFAEYLRCIFLESETAVAVLTSGPGTGPDRMLFNNEMAGTRVLLEDLGASGRVLNHAVVHPTLDGEFERMELWRDKYSPAGWKVYTLGEHAEVGGWKEGSGWQLDDERVGIPFLERAAALGVPLVCCHKGLSRLIEAGSPRDVGPAAAEFPELKFLVYHSGYEMPVSGEVEEGPYTDETADIGTNRLITSLRRSGIAPGSNVYAELGTTWFCMIRRPREAAHVLGKLLLAVGEDNLIWGTDGIWYGPSQPAIDAFRAFQIPDDIREQFGYPALTSAIKDKILTHNGARLYGIDLDHVRQLQVADELFWIREALAEYAKFGTPRVA